MIHQSTRSQLAARRADLLAELFFQELGATSISRPASSDLGYDLLVGFSNVKGGTNTFAVELRTTERPLGEHYPMPRRTYNRMAHSNLPGFLLVANVKSSQLHYAWLGAQHPSAGNTTVSIPIAEINEATKKKLKRQFQTVSAEVATA